MNESERLNRLTSILRLIFDDLEFPQLYWRYVTDYLKDNQDRVLSLYDKIEREVRK